MTHDLMVLLAPGPPDAEWEAEKAGWRARAMGNAATAMAADLPELGAAVSTRQTGPATLSASCCERHHRPHHPR